MLLSISLQHSLSPSCGICIWYLALIQSFQPTVFAKASLSWHTFTIIAPKRFLPNLFQRPRHLFTMAGPDYGALGATFKVVRMLQVISLLGCIGMAANFISEMVNQNDAPSKELVGTLSVVGIDLPTSFSPRLIPFLRPASRFSIAQSPSSFTSTTSFLTCSTPVWTACCSLPSLSSPSSSGDLYRT